MNGEFQKMRLISNIHSINVDVACDVGVDCAAVFETLRKLIETNINEHENFHDGFHWVTTTPHELAEKMPYYSPEKITRLLKKLEEKGYLKTGNYNRTPFDRTKSYACPKYEMEIRNE